MPLFLICPCHTVAESPATSRNNSILKPTVAASPIMPSGVPATSPYLSRRGDILIASRHHSSAATTQRTSRSVPRSRQLHVALTAPGDRHLPNAIRAGWDSERGKLSSTPRVDTPMVDGPPPSRRRRGPKLPVFRYNPCTCTGMPYPEINPSRYQFIGSFEIAFFILPRDR
eukprot:SAG31_NODE_650_length_13187_cov_3.011843_4_plen_171_part_00